MGKHIAVGVTGSIAAYKACELVRLFTKAGYEVSVVMTDAAKQFVTPLTFRTLSRNPVCTGLFDDVAEWVPGHISVADRCDALVIAPCTANVLAKLATGIADDALTATALACVKPLVLAPAMNVKMWEHPATRANLAALKSRGAIVVEPAEGGLACGTTGRGRMPEPLDIFNTTCAVLERA
ncbi:MAG: flavoprotein [Kiritimatiellia bacterium]|jgi:phosphopantothenoylcysteine decarboxylase/phosphopantothenate--cysteine ligase